jgi:large subunit ribosomal protein L10e
MARLRPARTFRNIDSQAWSRYSLKKQKKNYVRAMPRRSIIIFNMGTRSGSYDTKFTLDSRYSIQIRSNALESARQMATRYLETNLPGNYFFKVLVYPHNVIREHKMAVGAGADRLSKGMSLSFGRPIGVAARIKEGQPIFMVETASQNKQVVKEAYRRAASKLSGLYKVSTIRINESKAQAQ